MSAEGEKKEGVNDDLKNYEEKYVHQVYDRIASHFSATRYKAWPVVDDFLRALPPGSVGLDVGCGNGKYLTVNKDIFIVASDRSKSLVQIAGQHPPHDAIVADTLHLPHLDCSFDFAISIAVVHHLASTDRRVQAISSILQTLKRPSRTSPAGRALIFVWALEQKNSRRGWSVDDDQDVLVPWVLKETPQKSTIVEPQTFQRYYHLYKEGELQADVVAAGANIVRSGYDRDNWWVVMEPQPVKL